MGSQFKPDWELLVGAILYIIIVVGIVYISL